VATVTLDRPPANPIDILLLRELRSALGTLATDGAVRCIVITGAGDRFFSGGADIKQFLGLNAAERNEFVDLGIEVFDRCESMPKPVIAALNGFAVGGAGELAMSCDIRIAAARARLGQPEINLGLIPGWAGVQRLVRLVGEGRARLLLLTGEMITAEEAQRIGLVNKVVPDADLMTETMALASRLADQAPLAVAETKRLLGHNARGPMGSESIRDAGETFERLLVSKDAREGITAFLEKRPAKFTGEA
jgi:enoyl-CoA hydratase/carnithine racemase